MNKYLAMSLVAASVCGVGCYGSADPELTTPDETTEEAAASRAWERFVGAWVGDSGPFHGLVFTETTERGGRHYFADVDNGIRCVRAPCPSTSRAEGRYTATTRTLTLSPTDTSVAATTGAFQYTVSSTSLVLSRNGRVVARLHKATSYCAEADDCAEQRLIAPRCLGRWTCTTENACRYVCGRPLAGEGQTCGGIAGIQCESGLNCVLQGTYPDASGTCRRPTGPSCAVIRCAAGYTCRETNGVGACVPNATGPQCGSVRCASGQVCCNPLRGICTAPGMFCIQ